MRRHSSTRIDDDDDDDADATARMGSKKGSKVKRKTKGRHTKTHDHKSARRAHEQSSTHLDVRYEAFHAALAARDGGVTKTTTTTTGRRGDGRGATALELIDKANNVALDDDAGEYFATATGRRFSTREGLESHMKTKAYKRAVKALTYGAKPHTDVDAEMAAGMGRADNGRG